MADDLTDSAGRLYSALKAERTQAAADLEIARASGDSTAIDSAVMAIVDTDNRIQKLGTLYNQHVQSQQPVLPDPNAWRTKDLNQMTDLDGFHMTNSFLRDSGMQELTPDQYAAQIQERERRKSLGMYRET